MAHQVVVLASDALSGHVSGQVVLVAASSTRLMAECGGRRRHEKGGVIRRPFS